ncbi:kinase [Paracoccus sp. S-4012]|uniref:PfkB family carbohydrate kinase n=1 Tax=Paracoccus sp. S-4012 TaxID=2665648 RepID=UPI0012B05B6D|nr:PfkB family carbohydrate kinase [Paracoccus sp. S-4012]MRX51406.1 kinase [Paracoccus sp. S-4012]
MAPARVLCIGAAHWDLIARADRVLARGDDAPGRIRRAPGGVAANVAMALARRGLTVELLAAVGEDVEGQALEAALTAAGVGTAGLARLAATDTYVAVEDADGLVAAVADAGTLAAAGEALFAALDDGRLPSPWRGVVLVDSNLTPEQVAALAAHPALADAPLRLVPASPAKAPRLAPLLGRAGAVLHANRAEAEALCGRAFADATAAAEALIAQGAARAIVTDGPRRAADAARNAPPLSEAPPDVAAVRVTGAGDALLAAHLNAELNGASRADALHTALRAAAAHVAGDPA